MFKKVLVGVDGHQGGRDAIALAKLLIARDGELTLACVHFHDPSPVRSSTPAFEAGERERSSDLLATARERAGVEARLLCIGSPSVGRGLHELAERQQSDLIVVGSCRRGLVGRVLVGDDTRDALNGAPCAIAVAPAGYSEHPDPLSEIGVGYNGSPESQHALDAARELAAEWGAKLSAFQAVPPPEFVHGSGVGMVAGSITPFVDEARERIAALGGVEPRAAYGVAAEELALYGASVDLLVVGSRGYGPIGRLVHGSTSERLARIGRCPLLVLTRSAAGAEEASDRTETERETSGSVGTT